MIVVGNIYAGLSGGGGPTVVNTANGVSGDGSVGNPVSLGGINPLISDRTVLLSDFILDFFGDDGGGNQLDLALAFNAFIEVMNDAAGNQGSFNASPTQQLLVVQTPGATEEGTVIAINSGGVIGSALAYVNLGTGANKQIILNNNPASGILVNDSVDNIGLIGQGLYPISGPNQYAQYGNLSTASGVHTNSGISGDGTVGTPIILGGNPLTAPTTIDYNIQTLILSGTDGTNSSQMVFDSSDAILSVSNAALNGVMGATVLPGGHIETVMELQTGTGNKIVSITDNVTGIRIHDDPDNVGLIGDTLFPESSPNQYAQYGNIPAAPVHVAKNLTTGSINIITSPVGSNSVFRIDISLSIAVSSGLGVNVVLNWTDINGNPATQNITSGTPIGNFPGNSVTIQTAPATNISIDTLDSGGNTYSVVGAIQPIF